MTILYKLCRYFILLFLLFFSFIVKGQHPIQIHVKNRTLLAVDSLQPFWFTANQHGKIPGNGSFFNITELFFGQNYRTVEQSVLAATWGIDGVAAFGSEKYFQINRFFGGIAFKGWELKAGMFYDSIKYSGLSTTNGNLARSGNARPVPTVRFSTPGFKSMPFFKKWFSFKAGYEEGILNDERFVEDAHLHHKSLYGKFRLSRTMNFTAGLEHYVMWGGTSPVYGKLPGWENYLYYVLALPGNSNFPETDQKNISGNHLGTIQAEVDKQFRDFKATFYVSHPFEDNSGLNWHNWPDNLIGLYIHLEKEEPVISDVLYEFTNTRQQSVRNSEERKNDSYYNHGVYRSGFTYYGQIMSSPLFFPVIFEKGTSMGIASNRFFSHHVGMKGFIHEYFQWRGMFTYVEHWGTYSRKYNPVQRNVFGLLDVNFVKPGFPVELGISVAGDAVNTSGKNLGLQITVGRKW